MTKYKKNIFKLSIALTIFFVSVFQLKEQISSISWRNIVEVVREKPLIQIIGLICIGCSGILLLVLYDYILLKGFKTKNISKLSIIKYSWIANSFNALLGFGGIVGASIRYNFYRPKIEDLDNNRLKQSISLLLVSTISGVGVLALLVLSHIFPTSQLLDEDRKLKLILFVCAILFPIYILFITIKPPIKENRWLGFQFSLVSALDYLTLGIVLYAAMRFLNIQIRFIDMESIFIVATIAGIISMIPGGLGSFDLIFLIGATRELNVNSSSVLMALVLYRISYYFIPLIIALILGISELQNKVNLGTNSFMIISKELSSIMFSISKKQMKQINRGIISIVFLIGSIYFLFNAEILLGESAYGYVESRIQLFMYALSISASSLLFTSVYGIFKGSLATWKLVRILLIMLLICEIHMIYLYNELYIFSVGVLFILGIFLYLLKKQLEIECVKSSKYEKCWLIIPNVYILANIYMFNQYPIPKQYISFSFILLFLLAANLYFIFSRKQTRKKMYLESMDKSKAYIFFEVFGGGALSHLIHLNDNQFFCEDDLEVGIIFQENERNIFVLGDPIGNPKNIFEFLNRLLMLAERKGKHLLFYQVSTRYLNYYNELNFSMFKLGEEGIIDLEKWSLAGKSKRGFRATRNQAESLGYEFEMIQPPFNSHLYKELTEISNEWLAERKEMTFSVGRFERSYLDSSFIGVIKDKNVDRIIGFVSLMPTHTDDTISIDLIRWKENSTIAMMDLLYLKILQWSQEQKFCFFNLGMAPLSSSYDNTTTWKDTIFSSVYSNSRHFYSFKGLRSYKEKFKPNWEEKYLIYNKKSLFHVLYSCYSIIHKKNSKL
ncbi:phosphatidylglycerol lysyltransferase domain-containing protein [Enterococcus mundtii]|uniref:Phosphatidylglycerol lysyltransferase n=1 Tax=Enterococcus mundtii TaxID=53346 RepID=A0A848N400_ENTMU|nr:lysylphosphatidylglycerol synthetase family protein [Enterococcus mundtii]